MKLLLILHADYIQLVSQIAEVAYYWPFRSWKLLWQKQTSEPSEMSHSGAVRVWFAGEPDKMNY